MTTQSKKQKGRKLQQLVRDSLLGIGDLLGLQTGDVVSTSMGAQGVDVRLSPKAISVLGNLAIECKAVENLNVTGVFFEHASKYNNHTPLLVHRRNHKDALCTMRLSDYIALLYEAKKDGPK